MRRPSIRRHLLALLLLALSATWLASATLTYRDAHRGIDALLDAHLAQAARLLVAQAGHELEEIEFDDDAGTSADYRSKVAFQVRETDGKLVLRSANAPATPLAGLSPGFSEAELRAIRWRVYSAIDAERGVVVHVAEDHANRERIARRVALGALIPQLIALPVLGFAIWWVVGRSLRPLQRLSDELARRDPDDPQPLATDSMPIELSGLAGRLEELLLRVRDSLDSERRFTSHAAHELRTPVAALRAQAEVALATKDPAVRDSALHHCIEACDRMTRLVVQLLQLARADEAGSIAAAAPCELRAIAERVLADSAPAAMTEGTTVSLDARDAGIVIGDQALLEALVRNLVDNALQHGGPGGHVRVGLTRVNGEIQLTVEDAGPGVPPDTLERLGRRFYRAAEATGVGSGLGLSIVKRITELHGGSVSFRTGAAGKGLRVELEVPAAGTCETAGRSS
jgi:two-component system sensor histidine kinase QseC